MAVDKQCLSPIDIPHIRLLQPVFHFGLAVLLLVQTTKHTINGGSWRYVIGLRILRVLRTFVIEPWHLSTTRRISRIASHQPTKSGLEPFVVFSEISGSLKGPTACLWANDSIDLGSLVNWARYWRGPVSLVITTNFAPSASAYQNLLRRLNAIKTLPSLAYFSVHILQTNTQASLSPNIFLNIGRLFAPTDTVMMVPAEFSLVTPSAELYHSVSEHLSHHLQIPAVLTIAKEITFPVASFSPLVLPRDYPVWCTDRFFLASSRSSDWDVCLWQIWLEQQGKIGQVNVTMSHAPGPTVILPAIVNLPSLSSVHVHTAACSSDVV